MDRRGFLLTLAAGLAVAATGRGVVTGTRAGEGLSAAPAPEAPLRADPVEAAVEVPAGPVPPPPTGVVTALPGEGNGLALTIDDGTSGEVVAAFAALAVD